MDADADVTLQIGTEARGFCPFFISASDFFLFSAEAISAIVFSFISFFHFSFQVFTGADLTSGHFSFSGFLHSLCLSAGSFCGRIPDPVRKSRFHL